MQTLPKYPSFSFCESVITAGRIILVDEPLTDAARDALAALETADRTELRFLENWQLAAQLEETISNISNRPDVLYVFPGNGAQYPFRLSPLCQQSRRATVFAKRLWQPGSDPIALAGSIAGPFLVTDVSTVLVVDDVISSGLTMRTVHTANAWRFPRAQWIGVSWVAQAPQMRAASGINGFARVATACLVARPNGCRAPINSLSTLRRDPVIAASYARRHFRDPHAFLQIIAEPSSDAAEA